MTIVQSLGQLVDVDPGQDWSTYPRWRSSTTDYTADYATMYRCQPNVRICVDFLARNMAQLGLHTFRRVSDTDRVRLLDHPFAQLIEHPNGWTTRYRRISALLTDFGIYWNAYELKVRDAATGRMILVRIPPPCITPRGGLMPTSYVLTVNGKQRTLAPSDVVHYRGDNPDSPLGGLSPLETLRQTLAEEYARQSDREYYWQNAAQIEGVIERPLTAPDWSPEAREQFAVDFSMRYAGRENVGRTPVLEDGMTYKATTFSAEQSQYIESRRLAREEVARAYHIPLPMVGILDHATYSNVREQHKNLYQDCLGPLAVMLEEEHELQILPEFGDTSGVYVEFNIAEKLSGSFEEQVAVLQQAVGRPWMDVNEARSRFNLPAKGGDADKLVIPMNLVVDQPETGALPPPAPAPARGGKALQALASRTRDRQRQALMRRLSAGGEINDAWDRARWNRELAADLVALGFEGDWAQHLAEQMNEESRQQLGRELGEVHDA